MIASCFGRWAAPSCLALLLATVMGCDCSNSSSRSLEIITPADGARLTSLDDEDPTTPASVEITVVVRTDGLGDAARVDLFLDAGMRDAPVDTVTRDDSGMATFSNVSLSDGTYRLVAVSGSLESNVVEITVGGGCGAITFVDPAPMGMRTTLGPGEDRDGEACGATFETQVTISTDTGEGTMAQLFVNGTPRGTATVSGTVATFSNVTLDNRGDTPNSIEVDVGGCREAYPIPLFVDCAGVSCSITLPDTGSAFLNAADDMSMDPGFQTSFEVTTEDDAVGQPVSLIVDGDVGGALSADAASIRGSAVATFPNVSLAEGRVTVQAECRDSVGNVTRSGLAEWTVDITPCGVTITAPPGGGPTLTTTDDEDGSTPEIDITMNGSASGTDCSAARVGLCSAVAGSPFLPLVGSDFSGLVTLDSTPMQQLCAEVEDMAGNIGTSMVGVTVRTLGPQLEIVTPAASTRYNSDGSMGATPDLSRPSDTCEAAFTVRCTDVGDPVTLELSPSGTMLGSANCDPVGGLPAPFTGEATFAMVSLPSLNDGSAVTVIARQMADTLSGMATVSLFPDCDLPDVSFVTPMCGAVLRPAVDDSNSGMAGFQFTVEVFNNNIPKPGVSLTIQRRGGGTVVSTATSSIPSSGTVTRFTDANFASGGALEMLACATDGANNTFCTPACNVDVADLPQVTITSPTPGTLDGTTPPDCDGARSGYQVQVTATVTDAVDGSAATVQIGTGTLANTTVTSGSVTACVDAPEGRGINVVVTAMNTAGTGMGTITVDVDTLAPTAAITTLSAMVSDRRRGRVRFSWTAVDDNGFPLAAYEMRCADAPITTMAEWMAASTVAVGIPPAAAGTMQMVGVTAFRPGEVAHCTLRGTDPAGRLNPLGNSVDATISFAQQIVTVSATAQLGESIAAIGDVNGDGIDDVAVGAPVFFTGVMAENRTLLFFGSASGPPTTPSVDIIGGHFTFGLKVASIGDFNGDTRPDFAIAARGDGGGSGRVFVFYGRASTTPWPAMIDLRGACTADICLDGAGGFATFGWSLGAADFDDDGRTDLVVGAPFANGSAGRAYVILGSMSIAPGTSFTIPVGATITPDMTQPAGFTAEAPSGSSFFGTSVISPGDFLGASHMDLVVGASGNAGMMIDGRVSSIAGRAYPGASVGLQPIAAGGITTIDTGTAGGYGVALSVLDYDGDGDVDLAVHSNDVFGEIFMYSQGGAGFGSAVSFTNDVSSRSNDAFGSSLGLGWTPVLGGIADIDRDGRHDLLAGAAQRGTEAAGLELFYGRNPLGARNRTDADALVQPPPTSPAVRRVAATVGDVNGDGFVDMAIGDPTASSNAGRFFFLY